MEQENNKLKSLEHFPNSIENSLMTEILEFGFDKAKIELAMKFTKSKEEIINMIVKMNEEPEFYFQIKSYSQLTASEKNNDYKMVILVREDLHMSMGKTAAQVGHAVLGAYKLTNSQSQEKIHMWENFSGQIKIVLSVPGEKELVSFQKIANENQIITYMVIDAGRTEVQSKTCTCLAIGPDKSTKIDKITGDLKLLK